MSFSDRRMGLCGIQNRDIWRSCMWSWLFFRISKTWKLWFSLKQKVVTKTSRVYVGVKQKSSSYRNEFRWQCSWSDPVQGDQKLSCCSPYLAGRALASGPRRLRTQLFAVVRSSSSLPSQTTSVSWERRGDWPDIGDAPTSHSSGMRRDTRQVYQTLENPLCWSGGCRTPPFNSGVGEGLLTVSSAIICIVAAM